MYIKFKIHGKKEFFDNINSVINDWKNTGFTFNPKTYVPGLDDINLTYGNGEEKKGIEINTCVLFVDIRDSVQLTKANKYELWAKYIQFSLTVFYLQPNMREAM